MIVVDTCVVRYLIDGKKDALAFFAENHTRIVVPWITRVELRRHVATDEISEQDYNFVRQFAGFEPVDFRQFILNTKDYLRRLPPGRQKVLKLGDLMVFRCAYETQNELATNDTDLKDVAEGAGLKVIHCNWG